MTPSWFLDPLQALLPEVAPSHGESWGDIRKDFGRLILPRMTDWSLPGLAAFFPIWDVLPINA